jgi:hypothetical protein
MRQGWSTSKLSGLLLTGVIIDSVPTFAQACAVCGGAEDSGYFWGVLFLMSMPFALGSFVGGWLLYSYRRGQAGFGSSASTPTVERRMPRADSMSSAPDRSNDGPRAHQAETVEATTDRELRKEEESTP